MNSPFTDITVKKPWHTIWLNELAQKKGSRPENLISLKKKAGFFAKSTDKRARFFDIVSPNKALNASRATIYFIEEKISYWTTRGKELWYLIAIGLGLTIVLNLANVYGQSAKLKDEVVNSAYGGFLTLQQLQGNLSDLNLAKATALLNQAAAEFTEAREKIWFLEGKNSGSPGSGLFQNGHDLIEAGSHISQAGLYLTNLAQSLEKYSKNMLADQATAGSLTRPLANDLENSQKAFRELDLADNQLQTIPVQLIPVQVRQNFLRARTNIAAGRDFLKTVNNYVPTLLNLLGDRYPQRYLILLANNNERRPIMGFLGSLLLVDINDGKISKSDFFDVYHFDGQITENIPVPTVFSSLTKNWGLRDSNFSPDFATSAKTAAWLLEKGGGPGVDNVITLDLEVIREILKMTGPIMVQGLAKPLTFDNFDTVLSLIVESKLEGATSPKAILPRFAHALGQKLQTVGPIALIKIVKNMIAEKHLMAYSKDEAGQNFFKFLKIDGSLGASNDREDYLNLIHTSISGNKSDKYMREKIRHQTFVENSGALSDEVTIERTHTWNSDEDKKLTALAAGFSLKEPDDHLKEILGRGQNISALRVYVPAGSQLTQVVGIDAKDVESKIDPDTGKTYFAFTAKTLPGETVKISLLYQLPYQLNFKTAAGLDDYILNVQKQPGSVNDGFTKELILRSGVKHYESLPAMTLNKDIIRLETDLRTDRKMGVVVGR